MSLVFEMVLDIRLQVDPSAWKGFGRPSTRGPSVRDSLGYPYMHIAVFEMV